jgi:hypothetical protein
MPTSQAPLQPLQLPPPVSFQQQQTHPPPSAGTHFVPSVSFQQQQNHPPPSNSTHFVPPPIAANSTIPNVYSA